ncbi:MAG: hypothetical protein ACTSU5_16705 [Promethearchaeota archaeon]
MKIWIVYDSKFGNGARVAEMLEEALSREHEVKRGHVKDLSPKSVAGEGPGALVFGGPIHATFPSFTARSWVKKFDKVVRRLEASPKGAVFTTHLQGSVERKWLDFTKKLSFGANVFTEVLSVKVKGTKGPLEDGAAGKVREFVARLEEFL